MTYAAIFNSETWKIEDNIAPFFIFAPSREAKQMNPDNKKIN